MLRPNPPRPIPPAVGDGILAGVAKGSCPVAFAEATPYLRRSVDRCFLLDDEPIELGSIEGSPVLDGGGAAKKAVLPPVGFEDFLRPSAAARRGADGSRDAPVSPLVVFTEHASVLRLRGDTVRDPSFFTGTGSLRKPTRR
jgi:hypothetical protein